MKQLVTSAIGSNNNVFNEFIMSWIVSLRLIAKYNGEILLLDYGIPKKIESKLIDFNVRLLKCKNRGFRAINNTRFIDLIPILEKDYVGYDIAFFDIDIWFQDSINDIFNKIPENGVYFSIKPVAYPIDAENRNPRFSLVQNAEIKAHYGLMFKKFGGNINGGFFAGTQKNVINKLKKYKEMFATLYEMPRYNSNQFFLNMIFDFDKDIAEVCKWNCCEYNELELKDNIIYTKKGEKAVGLHCFAKSIIDPDLPIKKFYKFEDFFPELYKEYVK